MGAGSELLNAKKILNDIDLKLGDKIADFGVGSSGHMVFPASRIVGEKGVVYAVDIVKDVLSMVDSKRKMFGILNIETVWGDFERVSGVDIKAHSLDFVLLVNNLWCIKNIEIAISEAGRLLRSTGKLIIVDWRRKISHPAAPSQERRLSAMQTEAILLKGGFRKDKDLAVGETHWGMILSSAQ